MFLVWTQHVVINLECSVYGDLVELSYGDQMEWIEIGGACNTNGRCDSCVSPVFYFSRRY
jgi:hypothetical protein